MKHKVLLSIFTLIIGLTSINLFNSNYYKTNKEDNMHIVATPSDIDNKSIAKADTTILTMLEISIFLNKKKEHYPFSDEFIEKYQQASGGYIDFAKKTGHLVDREKHEPNQKWHFFNSWFMQSIEDGTLTLEDDAKKRVYNGLLCPELLLWIFEACDVAPTKVKAAKSVAEQGRALGTNVSTIAKNMRSCVPYEDIFNAVKNNNA